MAAFARRRGALIALPLLLIGAGGGTAGVIQAHRHRAAPAAVRVPALDARLILRPRDVPVSGILAGGATITGSIYPGIPYRSNSIQLTVMRQGRALLAQGRMALSVSMIGMRMLPVRAELRPAGRGYRGSVWLPMFGRYQGPVTVTLPGESLSGTIAITAPVPRLQL